MTHQSIKRTEGHFKGYDKTELFYQTWLNNNACGTIVLTHGISEHSECYLTFANGIADAPWDIYAWDMRGHGRSEGKRGLVKSFDEYTKDLKIFINHVHNVRKNTDGPLIILGHSMGGLVTLKTYINFSSDLNIDAICLSSPALGVSMEIPFIKDKMARILAHLIPSITLNNEVDYTKLASDPQALKFYENDPLRHDKISPLLYLGILESFEHVHQKANQITIPFFLQLSGIEKIVSQQASEEFFEKVSSKNKKQIIYKESLHEIFNDIEREQVFIDLKNFLNQFIEKSTNSSPETL